jgi:hypothetical protein
LRIADCGLRIADCGLRNLDLRYEMLLKYDFIPHLTSFVF